MPEFELEYVVIFLITKDIKAFFFKACQVYGAATGQAALTPLGECQFLDSNSGLTFRWPTPDPPEMCFNLDLF